MSEAVPKTEYQPGPNVEGDRPCADRLKMILSVTGEGLTGLSFLDIGCSTGWFCRELVRREAKVTGVEIDHGTFEKAKQYALDENLKINFVCEDYRSGKLRRNRELYGVGFDFVLYLSVLHYHTISERQAAMGAVSFLTRRGMFFDYAEHHSNGDQEFSDVLRIAQAEGFSHAKVLGKSKGGRILVYFPKAK